MLKPAFTALAKYRSGDYAGALADLMPLAEQLSDTDLATAKEIAARCRRQGYEFCVR